MQELHLENLNEYHIISHYQEVISKLSLYVEMVFRIYLQIYEIYSDLVNRIKKYLLLSVKK